MERPPGLEMPANMSTPAPTDGDAEIVRLVSERNAGGLRLLLAAHGSCARGHLRRSLGSTMSEQDLDDALGRASFQVWRRIESFDANKGSLRAWFLRIARNAGVEVLRERQRLPWEIAGDGVDHLPAPTADRDEDPAVLTPAPARAFLETLRQCIDALPRMQRQIIQADLRSGDVADAGELAKTLHTTRNTVYVTRSNARKALRKALSERGFVPGQGTQLSWT